MTARKEQRYHSTVDVFHPGRRPAGFVLAVSCAVFTLCCAASGRAQGYSLTALEESFTAATRSGDFKAHLAFIKKHRATQFNDFEFTWRAARGFVYAGDALYLKAIVANLEKAQKEADSLGDLLKAESKFSTVQEKAIYQMGKQGREYAQQAVKLAPTRVEGHYFLSNSISMYVMGIGIMRAIREGLWSKFKKATAKTLELDRTYSGAGPLRSKGRSFYAMPWPVRDLDDSLSWMKKALRYAPDSARNHLYIADTYFKLNKKKQALAHYAKAERLARTFSASKLASYMQRIAELKLRMAKKT